MADTGGRHTHTRTEATTRTHTHAQKKRQRGRQWRYSFGAVTVQLHRNCTCTFGALVVQFMCSFSAVCIVDCRGCATVSRIAGALFHVPGKSAPKVHVQFRCNCTVTAPKLYLHYLPHCLFFCACVCVRVVAPVRVCVCLPPVSATVSLLLCICILIACSSALVRQCQTVRLNDSTWFSPLFWALGPAETNSVRNDMRETRCYHIFLFRWF